MARRGFVMLAAALLLGGAATWLMAGWLDRTAEAQARAAQPAIPVVPILVAASDLKPGDTLAPAMVRWQPWPRTALRPEYLVKGEADRSAWIGAMMRLAVARGEPLRPDHLVKRGDRGIMAALIAPGMRAISIAVTPASGLAGFVGPGDRVDVLLTATRGSGSHIVGRTVAANLRVLAIDQRVDPIAVGAAGRATIAAPGTVTLEVTPRQAEEIAVSQELGRLSLTLRDLQAQAEAQSPADTVVLRSGPVTETEITGMPAAAARRGPAGGEEYELPLALAQAMPAAPAVVGSRPGAAAAPGSVEVVRGSVGGAAAAPASPSVAPEVP
jgi:pilus assembly protein CpaB